jgi:hypothetical protein
MEGELYIGFMDGVPLCGSFRGGLCTAAPAGVPWSGYPGWGPISGSMQRGPFRVTLEGSRGVGLLEGVH